MDLNTNMLYEGTPNFSMRMTSIAAILVLHQLRSIEQKIEKFNQHYWVLNEELHNFTATSSLLGYEVRIEAAPRLPDEDIVGTSFLFNVIIDDKKHNMTMESKYSKLDALSRLLSERGITNAWFGRKEYLGFTSTFKHWRYAHVINDSSQVQTSDDDIDIDTRFTHPSITVVSDESPELPKTNSLLSSLFDIPLYHTSSWCKEDFMKISHIIKSTVQSLCHIKYTTSQ